MPKKRKKKSPKKPPPIKIVKRDQRYERFCKEYIIDLNGTRAAIAAGYSKKTAYAAANRLLKNVEVKKRLAKMQERTANKLDLTAEWVLGELKKLASGAELDGDKIKALGWLGKHLKLFTDRVQLEGLEGLAEKIAAGRKRVGRK